MKFKSIIILLFIVSLPHCLNAAAWTVCRDMWSEKDEQIYSKFVEALCDSKYSNLNKFIRDPKANPLYGKEDNDFDLRPDCADLPYLLRAYVAYKLRLPFRYTSDITCNGGDQRYSRGNKPVEYKTYADFQTPQGLFYKVLLVNSGYYRIAADSDLPDHYPIKISKKTIIPGTIYYDPNGHVALVGKITENGRIRMMDAHPDKTISKPWFGAKFNKGTKDNGGGFRKWRPIRVLSNGIVVSTSNHNIIDYSEDEQFKKSYSYNGKTNLSYHDYVRAVVARVRDVDPTKEFVFFMQELYEDIVYRSMAVDLALNKKIHKQPHPGALPWNIYGTDGLWETYSTPSRDARLKVAFKEFYDNTKRSILSLANTNYNLARQVASGILFQYKDLSSQYCIYYTNSVGQQVKLTFDDVATRLFDMSFDPYHSAELRWGAKGAELATAKDDELKVRFYNLESKLRNNLERVYGMATPLSFGPEKPTEINIKRWLESFIRGENPDKLVEFTPVAYERVAANPEFVTPAKEPALFRDTYKPEASLKVEMMKLPELTVKNNKEDEVIKSKEIQNKVEKTEVKLAKETKLEMPWFKHVRNFAGALTDKSKYSSD